MYRKNQNYMRNINVSLELKTVRKSNYLENSKNYNPEPRKIIINKMKGVSYLVY